MATAFRLFREAERPSGAEAVTRQGDGLCIRVPPGAPRRWAGYPFGIALCVGVPVLYLVIWALVHMPAVQAAPPPGLGVVIPLATLVCGVLFALGLGCVVFGRRLAGQQGTIAVRDGQLWVEVTGLGGAVRQHWPVEQVECVQAAGSDWSSNGRPVMQLQIRPRRGPVVRVLTGREEPMLRRVAETLREELRLPSREERHEAWLRRRAPAPPPAGSGIGCEDHSDGLTIRFPPMGYWRHASGDVRGLLLFTIIWWTFLLVFTSLLLFAPWRWNGPPPPPWFFLLVPGAHWLIAVGLVLLLGRWARRCGVVSLRGERLVMVEAGRWRPRRGEWRCQEVYAISVECESSPGGGGFGDGGRSAPAELRIHTWGGDGKGFFAGRKEEELEWVAAALRQALQLTAENAYPA
jgi:hypothetical protein